MTCLSHQRWMMMTSPHLEGKVASSVEGEACLTMMTRYVKLNDRQSSLLFSPLIHYINSRLQSEFDLCCIMLCHSG